VETFNIAVKIKYNVCMYVKPTFSTNPSTLILVLLVDYFHVLWDRTGLTTLLDLFLVRFSFNFTVCPV